MEKALQSNSNVKTMVRLGPEQLKKLIDIAWKAALCLRQSEGSLLEVQCISIVVLFPGSKLLTLPGVSRLTAVTTTKVF